MNSRWLNNFLYAVPVVGGVKAYRDLKRQNSLIDQKIAQNSDLEPALRNYKFPRLVNTILPEFVGDILYGAGIGYFVFLGDIEPTISDIKILKNAMDVVLPTVVVIVNYMLKSYQGVIIREYERKGEVTLHTTTPITISIP